MIRLVSGQKRSRALVTMCFSETAWSYAYSWKQRRAGATAALSADGRWAAHCPV